MTRLWSLLLLLSVAIPDLARSEVPSTVNYQGRVLTNGSQAAAGPVDIDIGVWDAGAGGNRLYAERHAATPLVNGVFSLLLGTGSNAVGTFDANTFAAPGRWLELSIDGDTLSPRQAFSSVAYSFRAQRAVSADSIVGSDGAALTARAGGTFTVNGPNGNGNIAFGAFPQNPNHGSLGVLNADGLARATMFVDGTGRGVVGAFSPEGQAVTLLSSTSAGGLVTVLTKGGALGALMSTSADAGFINLVGKNGKDNVLIGPTDSNPNHGIVSVRDANGSERAATYVDAAGNGHVSVSGAGATEVFGGQLTLNDAAGVVRVLLTVDAAGQGVVDIVRKNGPPLAGAFRVRDGGDSFLGLFGPAGDAGNINVLAGAVDGDPNRGSISVHDRNSVARAGMYVNAAGRGQIFADTKNFVVDHPTRPGFQIVYTSLEGPEAAIYHRGRVRLADGRATIQLPEHFAVLALPDSLTVQLTPASLESKGLAVAAITGDHIEIGELQQGTGSYDVHFVVHAVRRGYEDQQPVVASGTPGGLGSTLPRGGH